MHKPTPFFLLTFFVGLILLTEIGVLVIQPLAIDWGGDPPPTYPEDPDLPTTPPETSIEPTNSLFASDFQFNIQSPSSKIITSTAAKHIDSVIPLSASDTQFTAKVFLDVECNLYTFFSITDLYPSLNDQVFDAEYLDLFLMNGWFDLQGERVHLSTHYNSYNLGTFQRSLIPNEKPFTITATTFYSPGRQEMGDLLIDTAGIQIQIKEIILQEYQTSTIGVYKNQYVDITKSATISTTDLRRDKTDYTDLNTYIQGHNLGLSKSTSYPSTPIQAVRTLQTGGIYNNRFIGVWQPDITITHETLTHRWQKILYDTSKGEINYNWQFIDSDVGDWVYTSAIYEDTPIDRIRSVQVQNYNARLKFRVECDLIADVAISTSDQSNFDVGLPTLELSDMYWRDLLYAESADITLTDPPIVNFFSNILDWLKEYWWIIALIGIVVVGILISPYLMQFLQMRRAMQKTIKK